MMVHTVVRLCTEMGRFAFFNSTFVPLIQASNSEPTRSYVSRALALVAHLRNAFIEPIVSGSAENVPMT